MDYLFLYLVLLLVAAIFVYRYLYAPYQMFKRCGIKGPTPLPVVGNYLDISKKGMIQFQKDVYRKYGPICGFYVGAEPNILVVDPEMIKQITVKEFDSFMDRVEIPKVVKHQARGLLMIRGEEWKTARKTLSPTFSSAKMKTMVPLLSKGVNTLVEIVGEKADTGKSVEIFRMFGSFTMESILATAFGRKINIQRGEADELTTAAVNVFAFSKNIIVGGIVNAVLSNFPWLTGVLQYFAKNSSLDKNWSHLHYTSLNIVQARRKESGQHKDLLQLMIDASGEDEDMSGEQESSSSSGCPFHQSKSGSSGNKLTDEQIVDHSVTFLLAGYETTANALTYTSYLLALNPEIQEKLQREIDDYFEEKPDASPYEATQEITYLDNVIQESLRLYPPAYITPRDCLKTTTINGVTFPKGCVVILPIHLLHTDPKYWEDPQQFNPDRFTAEEKAKRPPLAHMPFGFGPRNCIGMRFALLEAKMALIEILKRYTFVRAPDTEVPLQLLLGITMSPKNGIFVKVVSRN